MQAIEDLRDDLQARESIAPVWRIGASASARSGHQAQDHGCGAWASPGVGCRLILEQHLRSSRNRLPGNHTRSHSCLSSFEANTQNMSLSGAILRLANILSQGPGHGGADLLASVPEPDGTHICP